MCCHTGMPCLRHKTWQPTPSEYSETWPTCGCAIHWCGTQHWNITATHFNVLDKTWPIKLSLTFHIHQRMLNCMILLWWSVGSSVESTVPTRSWTRDLLCAKSLIVSARWKLLLVWFWEKPWPRVQCQCEHSKANNYMILDGLEADTRIYCPRC